MSEALCFEAGRGDGGGELVTERKKGSEFSGMEKRCWEGGSTGLGSTMAPAGGCRKEMKISKLVDGGIIHKRSKQNFQLVNIMKN